MQDMDASHKSIRILPDVPGVYLFKHGRKVLYVGKATNLRDRVRSYFDDDLIASRGPRLVDMVTNATGMIYHTTPTVLEALVLETSLIKKYLPPANAIGKDDTSFLYAVITKEAIPRVLAVRGKNLDFKTRVARTTLATEKLKAIYGPFPSGAQLKEALRLLQRIFPFFDTARPVDEKKLNAHHQARIEFNKQIRQYPRDYTVASYRKTIRNVELFLSGRAKALRKVLAQDMKRAAREERFEDAAEARRELYALDHVQDVSLIKDENLSPSTGSGQLSYGRVEAYDTAHLSGTNAIGVMTVLEDGEVSKKDYRTFRIRGVVKSDDIASLKELLTRRFGHPEWPFPRAIVIDGGTTHKKAAENVLKELKELKLNIPVAAVVKDERHRPREVIGAQRAHISESDAVLANSEAHRFSLARHRYARSKNLRTK